MLIFLGLIALVFLFLISAFWSGSETAITRLSKYKIKKLIAINKSLSAPLERWLHSPYYLLTTILVGNTVTNFVLGFVATLVMINAFNFLDRSVVELSTWLFTTSFLIVFSELTPKIYARLNPEKVTIISLPILHQIEQITRPFIYPFKKIVRFFFPRTDILPPIGRLAYLSIGEIKALISEATHAGMLGKETTQMLERVINLGNLNVEKIMRPVDKIEAVKFDEDEEMFLDIVVETGRSRVPVYGNKIDEIIGFVYTKDVLWAWRNNKGRFSKDLIRPPYFISKDKKVHDLLKEFQSGQTHMAFVEDSLGNLQGLVTLEDILEEIVGEILSECELNIENEDECKINRDTK